MTTRTLSLTLGALPFVLGACASVQMMGYEDGWVKTSNVSYGFTGPPLLDADADLCYAAAAPLPAFDSRGYSFCRDGVCAE